MPVVGRFRIQTRRTGIKDLAVLAHLSELGISLVDAVFPKVHVVGLPRTLKVDPIPPPGFRLRTALSIHLVKNRYPDNV